MNKVTIRDVAGLAGVSTKTVARVTRGEASIRDEACQRVRIAIDLLDYRPDEHARQPAAGQRA